MSAFVQFSGWSVFLKNNWDTATFVTNYIPLVLFPILYLGSRWWKRTQVIDASEMDFQSGLAEIEAETYDEPPPKNKWEAFWQWLVCVSQLHLKSFYSDWTVQDVRGVGFYDTDIVLNEV
jgi:amino acid permease